MEDWAHGNEGTTDWNEVMAREDMIVGGPAVRLDTTVLSSMRPHRAAAPPVGVPVVKLFAVVGLVDATYDHRNDKARFGSLPRDVDRDRPRNQVEVCFATGLASPKKRRREDFGASHPGGQPFTALHEHAVGSVMCSKIAVGQLPAVSLGTMAVNQSGRGTNDTKQEGVMLEAGGNETVQEDVPLHQEEEDVPVDPAPERELVRFFRVAREKAEQQEKDKADLAFEKRREQVGFMKAQDESVLSVANGWGSLANDCRDIVRSMEYDESSDEGLITGGVRKNRLPPFDPNLPYRIELEVSEDMFGVVYLAEAADGQHVEGRDIQHRDNLSSDLVAAHRASMDRGYACGGVTKDDVISVGSGGAGASPVNAAPTIDGYPVSPNSLEALMSTVVGTGVVTDPATPRERGLAKSAARQEDDRKSLRKDHSGAGWSTPPPTVRVSSPSVPKQVQAGEMQDVSSSCSST
jgi:hypothetical protein